MVRYKDGPTAEATIQIEATREAVWAVISNPGFPAISSNELQEAAWIGSTESCLGARILGRSHHEAIGDWTTESLVVEWMEESHWSWMVGDAPHQASQWWFEIEDLDDTTVLVTQRVRIGPGDSGLTPAIQAMPEKEEKIVARRMQHHHDNMVANLQTLKDRLAED